MSEQLLTKKFPASSDRLKELRELVRDISLAQGMAEAQVERVIIGVNEACMNIIEHAYKKQPGDIIIEIQRDRNSIIYE